VTRIDGSRALTAESAAELGALCDRAGASDANGFVIIRVSGVPGPGWSNDLPVALMSRWERGLRRLGRLPAVTIAVADDDRSRAGSQGSMFGTPIGAAEALRYR
jgi:isomerase DpgB